MIILFFISILAALIYYLILKVYSNNWNAIEGYENNFTPSVSLIIPFRNEEENLKLLCQSLDKLNYEITKLEIIFVNDHSSDNSIDIIKSSELKYKHQTISLTTTEGKKEAIKLAWTICNTEIVVHTDADCTFNTNWLNTLMKPFKDQELAFVSGPVKFYDSKLFWQRVLALEFAGLIGAGAAHIQMNHPLMCNGANLAYRMSITAGTDLRTDFASGDDVYLMQSVFNQSLGKIAFCKDREAIVETHPPATLKSFLNQRLRWAGKNTTYKDSRNMLVLSFIWFYHMLILINIGSRTKIGLTIALFMIVIKAISELMFGKQLAHFFDIRKYSLPIVAGQIPHLFYIALIPIFSKLVPYSWKGRKLK